MKLGVPRLQRLDETAVEADQAFATIEIIERRPKPREMLAINRHPRARHSVIRGGERPDPQSGIWCLFIADLNRSITAAGIGIPFSSARIVGILPGPDPRLAAFHRHFAFDGDAMPDLEARTPEFATSDAISAISLNRAGLRKRALASTSGIPTMPNAAAKLPGRTPSAVSIINQEFQSKYSNKRLLNAIPGGVAMPPFDGELPAVNEIDHALFRSPSGGTETRPGRGCQSAAGLGAGGVRAAFGGDFKGLIAFSGRPWDRLARAGGTCKCRPGAAPAEFYRSSGRVDARGG